MTKAVELFANAEVILFDFDGPVCSVFANHPPEHASGAAVAALADRGIELPDGWASRRDPHNLLKDLAQLPHLPAEDLRAADEAVCSHEVQAVFGAVPTAGIDRLLASHGARRWAIVSNNCSKAITRYLERVSFKPQPQAVVGRELGNPQSLKPAPQLLHKALRKLGARTETAVFIGDSTSDVQAGILAGVPVIGYANKPGKAAALVDAGASAVVNKFAALLPVPRSCEPG